MAGAERWYFLAMAALGAVVAIAIVAFWLGASSADEDDGTMASAVVETPVVEATEVRTLVARSPSPSPTAPPAPTQAPAAVTATPTEEPAATEPPVLSTVAPAPQPPDPTPEPATPIAAAPPTPPPEAAVAESLSGNWRITDTVTEGAGIGQTFTFDVVLTQSGSSVQGGNFELSIVGTVEDGLVTAQFTQPAGISGTFVWTLAGNGAASGTFESSVPNRGTSQLQRLQ